MKDGERRETAAAGDDGAEGCWRDSGEGWGVAEGENLKRYWMMSGEGEDRKWQMRREEQAGGLRNDRMT